MEKILAISFLFVGSFSAYCQGTSRAPQTADAQTLLTFNSLSPGPSGSSINIPNGYGGLQWSGFGVINATLLSVPEGYLTGMVSGPNVAFNDDPYGPPSTARTAYISSSSPFNFDSAYLTGAFSPGLNVEVQGFVGTKLTYNNTYTVDESGPLFINFDYSGVNEVKFIPLVEDIFVVDNVTISAVPEPNTWALLTVGAALAAAGNVIRKPLRPGCQSSLLTPA